MKLPRRQKRRLVVALADTHAGHVLGLLNPETVLVRQIDEHGEYEEWIPELTATQRLLWELYQEHMGQLEELAGKDEIVVFHVGDPTHGTKYAQGLIADVSRSDQRTIAAENLKPIISLSNVKTARLFTGTAAHVWPGSADAKVAWQLQNDYPQKDVQSVHHSRTHIDGVLFDTAHHGPHPGSRDWLRGNVALYYLRDRIYRDRRMGKEPARVYIRAHRHTYVPVPFIDWWQGQQSKHDLTLLPSYSGLGAFARKVTQSEPELCNGMCVYELVGGELKDIHPLIEYTDLRLEETL
jgi:hypothetical protein